MKMTRRLIILLLALLAWTTGYVLMLTSWGRQLSGLRCENFGCMGNGLIFFAYIGLCPIVFALLGAFIGTGTRLGRAAEAGVICLLVMIGATTAASTVHQIKIARAMAEACRETPELYPEQCGKATPQ